jgi:glucose/arabinose dehydrogenase
MDNPDHSTRTLLLSRFVDGMLVVSRGSADNVDLGAASLDSGRSQIRAFNLTELADGQSYDYTTQGLRLGWGLRNSVGVAEHPDSGGIWSVENSVDDAERLGVQIQENNPGEELNFHGYLNGTEYAGQGGNYGYPVCYATWNRDEIPQNEGIETGTQFAIGTPNNTVNDDFCQNNRIAPRLTFPAHWAPLESVPA